MSYVELLSVLSVALAVVWFVYSAVSRLTRMIQSTLKGLTEMQVDRPATLSALGDQLDALQIAAREIDTKVERALSLGRSNRARITNLQHRGEGEDEPGGDSSPVPSVSRPLRLPGRTS